MNKTSSWIQLFRALFLFTPVLHLLLLHRVKEAVCADVIHPPLSTCLLNWRHSRIKWHSVSESVICIKTFFHSKIILLGLNPLKCLTWTTLTCAGPRFAATKVFAHSLTQWCVHIHQVSHLWCVEAVAVYFTNTTIGNKPVLKPGWLSRYNCEL